MHVAEGVQVVGALGVGHACNDGDVLTQQLGADGDGLVGMLIAGEGNDALAPAPVDAGIFQGARMAGIGLHDQRRAEELVERKAGGALAVDLHHHHTVAQLVQGLG